MCYSSNRRLTWRACQRRCHLSWDVWDEKGLAPWMVSQIGGQKCKGSEMGTGWAFLRTQRRPTYPEAGWFVFLKGWEATRGFKARWWRELRRSFWLLMENKMELLIGQSWKGRCVNNRLSMTCSWKMSGQKQLPLGSFTLPPRGLAFTVSLFSFPARGILYFPSSPW